MGHPRLGAPFGWRTISHAAYTNGTTTCLEPMGSHSADDSGGRVCDLGFVLFVRRVNFCVRHAQRSCSTPGSAMVTADTVSLRATLLACLHTFFDTLNV